MNDNMPNLHFAHYAGHVTNEMLDKIYGKFGRATGSPETDIADFLLTAA